MEATQIRQAIQRVRKGSGLTYRKIGEKVGCSANHARKMGCGAVARVSPELAKRFERAFPGLCSAEEFIFPERFTRDGKRRRGAA